MIFFLQTFLVYFHIINFFMFCGLSRSRFKQLNEFVKFCLSNNLIIMKSRKIINMHGSLCDVISLINKSFSVGIIFILIKIILQEIFTVFSTVFMLINNNFDTYVNFLIDLINLLCWLTLLLILKIIICYSGASLTTSTSVLEKMILNWINKLSKDDELLEHQLLKMHYAIKSTDKNVENALFIINWKLLLMVKLYNVYTVRIKTLAYRYTFF